MPFPSPVLTPCLASLALAGLFVGARGQPAEPLTTALQVRSLSVAQAESGLPVRLRGVVVFMEPASVFLQDETSTTFFRPPTAPSEAGLRIGDIVEIEGRTRMGLFQPGVDTTPYRVVGHAPVPAGIPASYDDLATGRFHYRRVTIEGVFRSVETVDETRSLARVALGSHLVDVRVEAPPDGTRPLIDARVRVSGLAAGLINERRQLVQPFLRLMDWSDIQVLERAPPADDVPLISAAELRAFREPGLRVHRVRVRGVVTAAFSPTNIFLRQGNTAFGVRLRRPAELSPGDQIEVIGFSVLDRYSASVTEADVLHRSSGPPPAPVPIDSIEQLSGIHDGELVTLSALLRDAYKTEEGYTLMLQGDARTLPARLPEGVAPPTPGTRLQVTAICIIESARRGTNAFTSSPDVVVLSVRSAGDLTILTSPPWWTARRLTGLLAALALVTVLAALWIAALRRQVRRQTAALRQRIESEAALEERQRIAREFHDSLEQDLTGLGLRLDAAATRPLDEKGRQIIDVSRGLLARIQAETRNLVSDLRDSAENNGDLASAIEAVAAAAPSAEGTPEVRLNFTARPPVLSAGTIHHLRMMVRESVANALRHARARNIVIQVTPEPGRLLLSVTDDGLGFDVLAATESRNGHFGCVGLRERARKLGARITWRSTPGRGTAVEVELPLGPAGPRSTPARSSSLARPDVPSSTP